MTSKELGIMMQAARVMAKAAHDRLTDDERLGDPIETLLANAMMIVQVIPKEKILEVASDKDLENFPIPDLSVVQGYITLDTEEPAKRKRGRPPKPKI